MKTKILILSMIVLLTTVTAGWAADAPDSHSNEAAAAAPRSPWATIGIALSAALAVGLCAIATGIAQSRIGAAGCGAIAEKPETGGTVILLVAIPETMVILGFVVGVILLFTL